MKKVVLFYLCLTVILAVPVMALAGGNTLSEEPKLPYVPGELLVKYNSTLGAAGAESHMQSLGASSIKFFKSIGWYHVRLPEGMSVEQAMQTFSADANVEIAEPNYIYSIYATPNDSSYGNLWGMHNTGQDVNGVTGTNDADVDAPEAWDQTTGSSDVIVAVIDSGVDYNHPDLKDNIWTNPGETPGDGIDNDGNGYVDDIHGWDFVDNDNDPMDYNDHGTHCAGTVAAKGNNSIGVAGMAWTAKIMVLRGLDTMGSGASSDLLSCIEYANANGAHILSNSWGGGSSSSATKAAIDASSAVVVCAAGNDGTDNDSIPHYPSSYESSQIIAVAATDQNDELASFSCYGATSVDVGAPGVNIFSTRPGREDRLDENFDSYSPPAMGTWTTNGTWGTSSLYSNSSPNSIGPNPGGNYADSSDTYAQSPAIDLTGKEGCKMEFQIYGSVLSGDIFTIQMSTDGTTFTTMTTSLGTQMSGSTGGSWFSGKVDMKAYDNQATVYIRLRLDTSSSGNDIGFYLDDIKVTCASTTYAGTEYKFLDGTSMATPLVSGLCALIKAKNPGYTNTQIKSAVETNVDAIAALAGKVLTGGRVNANKAVGGSADGGGGDGGGGGGCFLNLQDR